MSPIKRTAVRIRQLREAKGISQRELAEKAGLSREYVLRLEGAQQDPTLGTLEKIAKALGVPVGMLVK
jgi:transcriptional regulator with XRE-family HTH domain